MQTGVEMVKTVHSEAALMLIRKPIPEALHQKSTLIFSCTVHRINPPSPTLFASLFLLFNKMNCFRLKPTASGHHTLTSDLGPFHARLRTWTTERKIFLPKWL